MFYMNIQSLTRTRFQKKSSLIYIQQWAQLLILYTERRFDKIYLYYVTTTLHIYIWYQNNLIRDL